MTCSAWPQGTTWHVNPPNESLTELRVTDTRKAFMAWDCCFGSLELNGKRADKEINACAGECMCWWLLWKLNATIGEGYVSKTLEMYDYELHRSLRIQAEHPNRRDLHGQTSSVWQTGLHRTHRGLPKHSLKGLIRAKWGGEGRSGGSPLPPSPPLPSPPLPSPRSSDLG